MYLVGLTGGIGSGKSTVAARLVGHGAALVDADAIARDIVAPGTPALAEIAERFGDSVIADDGTLDRPALAAMVFHDDDARAALNAITHPRIGQGVADRIAALAAEDDPDEPRIVVLDIPLLVESRLFEGHDALVVVVADEDLRIERLVSGRDMDPDDVRARIAVQISDAERVEHATHVVANDGDLDALHAAVDELWGRLVEAAAPAGTAERP